MKKTLLVTLTILCGIHRYSTAAETQLTKAENQTLDSTLGSVESIYTAPILEIIKNWPPKEIKIQEKDPFLPVEVECFETPKNSLYIGMLQVLWIHAPLESVESIIDDFANYKNLFLDFKDIHVISTDKNKSLTYWEQYSPVFFAPNIRYQLFYLINKPTSKMKIYRYGLKESNYLKSSDGVIVIEKMEDSLTRLVEYDFFDADWGLAKTFGEKRIWLDSVKGNILSDLDFKLKAENPNWTYDHIHKEAENLIDKVPYQKAYENKKTTESFLKGLSHINLNDKKSQEKSD